jgi:predicted acylesterase/phospholipase RssA
MTAGSNANPGRLCDLVMKGGITSGVIYPSAVCELAKQYNFKNIGGTSAGAIAAAAAAAAEYGRRTSGGGTAFTGLAELPDWIGKPGRLVKMFQPERQTRPLLSLLMAGTGPKTAAGKAAAVTGQLLLRFPLTALVLIALVWTVRHYVLEGMSGIGFAYAFATTIVLALLLFVSVVLLFLYRQITRTVPANFYGMSRAYDPKADAATAEAPLTNWLTHYLNELAGKPLAAGPLTFGDLYTAPRAAGDPEPAGPDYRAINLEMMTTALNHGRPYRLPFREPDRVFYFCGEDFAKLFPPLVVEHMKKFAPVGEGIAPHAEGCQQLYHFPDQHDLPVVVATRMSLSFPVLLSAVPLYAVDFTLKENEDKESSRRAERCWFSDGGITSNLPIHFFDAPLPLWPTFAINLKQFHPDHTKEEDAVWYPNKPNSGWLPLWTRFEEPGKFGPLAGFVGAIMTTMQNWQDNTQARVPGYRDRLVHVSQRNDEGGLNLDMPEAVVKRLAGRGTRAGQVLVNRFGDPDGWTEHRWVRFRSCMELTEDWIRQLAEAYPNAIPPDPELEQVLLRPEGAPPTAYRRLSCADQQRAKNAMDALLQLWAAWANNGTGFQIDPPRPTPELRIKARI